MAVLSAVARSMLRAASSRSVASSTGRFASQSKSSPPLFRSTTRRSPLFSPLRNPVESSFCVESMLPYHTATASALMTSMLSITGSSYGWLSDGIDYETENMARATNLPALKKLDVMLIDCHDKFREKHELYYITTKSPESKNSNSTRNDDKWWLPTVKIQPKGLSEMTSDVKSSPWSTSLSMEKRQQLEEID